MRLALSMKFTSMGSRTLCGRLVAAQIEQRKDILKLQFDAIDRLGYQVSYEDAQHLAGQFLAALD
jgi:hypothetical protein